MHTPEITGVDEHGQPIVIAPQAITLSWPTLRGCQYVLLCSPDLSSGSWIPVDDPVTGDGNPAEFGFEVTNPSLFWRVAVTDNNADADGDLLGDYEEYLLGTDPDNSDTDGDGLTDHEEVILESDPTNTDSDNDTIPDNLDADPTDTLVDWERTSESPYLLLDVDAPAGQHAKDLNDKGEVLFGEGIYADGQWIPILPEGPITGVYAREPGDQGDYEYESQFENWISFNNNRQMIGLSWCRVGFTPDPGTGLGGGDSFSYSIQSQPQANAPQYNSEMFSRLPVPLRNIISNCLPLGISADGTIVGVANYYEDMNPDPETTDLEERSRLVVFPPDNSDPLIIEPPDDYLLTILVVPDMLGTTCKAVISRYTSPTHSLYYNLAIVSLKKITHQQKIFTIPHELGHILTNHGHFGEDYEQSNPIHKVEHNLMKNQTSQGNTITGTKRWFKSQDAMIQPELLE